MFHHRLGNIQGFVSLFDVYTLFITFVQLSKGYLPTLVVYKTVYTCFTWVYHFLRIRQGYLSVIRYLILFKHVLHKTNHFLRRVQGSFSTTLCVSMFRTQQPTLEDIWSYVGLFGIPSSSLLEPCLEHPSYKTRCGTSAWEMGICGIGARVGEWIQLGAQWTQHP